MAEMSVKVDILNDILLKKPLVFIQNEAGNDFMVIQDGEVVKGLRSITINADIDDFTTHEIEYLTGYTQRTEHKETEENAE